MLKLCHIGPSLITQRGKGSDHTIITQTFECHLVFRLSQPVKVPACKMKAMKLQTSYMVSHIIHAILLSFRQDKFPAITAGLHKKDRLGRLAMVRIYDMVANLTLHTYGQGKSHITSCIKICRCECKCTFCRRPRCQNCGQ